MAATNHLNITKLEASQAQKDVTINEGFVTIDAMLAGMVLDRDLATPPGSPATGAAYIVAASATGDWLGKENNIAYYTNGAWYFIAPKEGFTKWVADEDIHIVYDGAAWGNALKEAQNLSKLGVNATADTTNRLSVTAPAALFNAETDDFQVKINKASASDNASVIFQNNFSGRAEFGLTGDDDFHMKVSPDGSTFHESLIIDKDTGRADVQNGMSFNDGTDTLTEYEQGSFTPELNGSTPGTTTHTVNDGTYTRIGDLVFGNGRVIWSNTTAAGNARLLGFPFAVASGTENRGMVNWQYYHSLNVPAGFFPAGYPEPGQTYITLRKAGESSMSGAMQISELSTSGELYFTFMYRI